MLWVVAIFSATIVAFSMGLMFAHVKTQPDTTPYWLLRILIFLGVPLSGLFLGAMTAYNSGLSANESIPWLVSLIGTFSEPTQFFMWVGGLSGLCTGLSTVLPLADD